MTELGLEIATTTATSKILKAGAVIGANAPKPHRATKYLSSGETESSYISDEKITEASATWSIQSPKFKSPPLSDRSTLVYVLTKVGTSDVPYGWAMPNYQMDAISAEGLTNLGIVTIPSDAIPESLALFGLNAPKLGKVKQDYSKLPGKEADETTSSVCSTFYADSLKATALTDGWIPITKPTIYGGYSIG
ncbi:hypothetical protein [Okeania sp.]|uniref:hypothetical protein n=1 Tax=Okeania sp. TaxID=3100323 RepID=UPI002B4B46D9|nr:hypothetical protein [Okeania sp.]MEB3341425.1 hypothetical protein [Okeania sp.]